MIQKFKPEHKENRLKHEGDVVYARSQYYKDMPTNLQFLFKKRFEWMNNFIRKGDKVLEVGCGTGVSKDFIRKDCDVLFTDFAEHHWIDKKVDALNTKFSDNTFDVILCSNMIHHIPFPKRFFLEMRRILKSEGYLLIQEINCSFMMKKLLKVTRHEGWDLTADVYDLNHPANDEKDLWSANCAIPNLLFDNIKKFKKEISFFQIKEQKFSEFFIFPLSGGVVAKLKIINLPFFILKIIDKIDNFLIYLFPTIFALQRKIILKAKK